MAGLDEACGGEGEGEREPLHSLTQRNGGHFERLRPELYDATRGLKRVSVFRPIISNKLSFAFLPARTVFAHKSSWSSPFSFCRRHSNCFNQGHTRSGYGFFASSLKDRLALLPPTA